MGALHKEVKKKKKPVCVLVKGHLCRYNSTQEGSLGKAAGGQLQSPDLSLPHHSKCEWPWGSQGPSAKGLGAPPRFPPTVDTSGSGAGMGLVLFYALSAVTRVAAAQCRKCGNHGRGQSGGNKHGVIGLSVSFQPNNIHTLVLCTNHLFAFLETSLA